MIIYLILGIFGVVAYTLATMDSTINDLKTLNEHLSAKNFFLLEWRNIALSLLLVFVFALIKDEVFDLRPAAEKYVKMIFFGIGVLGSYGFKRWLGQAKKYVRSIMDAKSNIADEKDK